MIVFEGFETEVQRDFSKTETKNGRKMIQNTKEFEGESEEDRGKAQVREGGKSSGATLCHVKESKQAKALLD